MSEEEDKALYRSWEQEILEHSEAIKELREAQSRIIMKHNWNSNVTLQLHYKALEDFRSK